MERPGTGPVINMSVVPLQGGEMSLQGPATGGHTAGLKLVLDPSAMMTVIAR